MTRRRWRLPPISLARREPMGRHGAHSGAGERRSHSGVTWSARSPTRARRSARSARRRRPCAARAFDEACVRCACSPSSSASSRSPRRAASRPRVCDLAPPARRAPRVAASSTCGRNRGARHPPRAVPWAELSDRRRPLTRNSSPRAFERAHHAAGRARASRVARAGVRKKRARPPIDGERRAHALNAHDGSSTGGVRAAARGCARASSATPRRRGLPRRATRATPPARVPRASPAARRIGAVPTARSAPAGAPALVEAVLAAARARASGRARRRRLRVDARAPDRAAEHAAESRAPPRSPGASRASMLVARGARVVLPASTCAGAKRDERRAPRGCAPSAPRATRATRPTRPARARPARARAYRVRRARRWTRGCARASARARASACSSWLADAARRARVDVAGRRRARATSTRARARPRRRARCAPARRHDERAAVRRAAALGEGVRAESSSPTSCPRPQFASFVPFSASVPRAPPSVGARRRRARPPGCRRQKPTRAASCRERAARVAAAAQSRVRRGNDDDDDDDGAAAAACRRQPEAAACANATRRRRAALAALGRGGEIEGRAGRAADWCACAGASPEGVSARSTAIAAQRGIYAGGAQATFSVASAVTLPPSTCTSARRGR